MSFYYFFFLSPRLWAHFEPSRLLVSAMKMQRLIAPTLPANLIRSSSVVWHRRSFWTDKNQRSEKTERGRGRDRQTMRRKEEEEKEGGRGEDKSFNAYASRLENDYLAVWLWRCVWRPDSRQRLRSLMRKNWVCVRVLRLYCCQLNPDMPFTIWLQAEQQTQNSCHILIFHHILLFCIRLEFLFFYFSSWTTMMHYRLYITPCLHVQY